MSGKVNYDTNATLDTPAECLCVVCVVCRCVYVCLAIRFASSQVWQVAAAYSLGTYLTTYSTTAKCSCCWVHSRTHTQSLRLTLTHTLWHCNVKGDCSLGVDWAEQLLGLYLLPVCPFCDWGNTCRLLLPRKLFSLQSFCHSSANFYELKGKAFGSMCVCVCVMHVRVYVCVFVFPFSLFKTYESMKGCNRLSLPNDVTASTVRPSALCRCVCVCVAATATGAVWKFDKLVHSGSFKSDKQPNRYGPHSNANQNKIWDTSCRQLRLPLCLCLCVCVCLFLFVCVSSWRALCLVVINLLCLLAALVMNSLLLSLSIWNLIKSNCKGAEGIQRSRRAAETPCMLSAETQLFIFKFVCLLKATTPSVQSYHDVYAMCYIKCYFNVHGQLNSAGGE